MSQGSSNPTSPSRPVPASEQQEIVTPASHVFGLSHVSASLEAFNIEIKRKPTVVHGAQTSYSPGASRTPWPLNMSDSQRSTPASPQKPKGYALQIWLEVEVGPGYFVPPEDDSYSMDFTFPGCMKVYLDRGGHILAFYGQKGSPKVGLIQEVAIEASHAVTEITTWMGLTAKWEVKCVSLAEANDILAECRRLEQENHRRECRYYQEHLASMHQPLAPQLSLPLSSLGPLHHCLSWQRWSMIKINKRGVGLRPASPQLVDQPPPRSVRYLHPYGVHILRPLMMIRLQM